jgi:hypothetical protein
MANDKIFANGFIFKRNDNAPDFVIGNISIKSEEAIQFIKANDKNGWVNLKINKSQGGKAYIELDTWEAKGSAPKSNNSENVKHPFYDGDSPF